MGRILIAGAGLGGLAAAIALYRAGLDVAVFEAAERIEPVGAGIGLATNAVKALRALGVAERALPEGRALDVAWLRRHDGTTLREADAAATAAALGDRVGIFAIHRAALHRVLLDALPKDAVALGRRAVGAAVRAGSVELHFEDGDTAEGDALVAADGLRSVLRDAVAPGSLPRFSGVTCWRGVLDAFPASVAPGRVQEIWGDSGMFGIVPIAAERIYWYAALPAAAPDDARYRAFGRRDLAGAFAGFPAEVRELIDATPEERILWNDIFHLPPLRRLVRGRLALLGDAAHAMPPYLGQGACQAFEDAVVLGECLAAEPEPVLAFAAYERRRRRRAASLQRASLQQVRAVHARSRLGRALRDTLVRRLPEALARRRIRRMLTVDFAVPEPAPVHAGAAEPAA